MDEPGEQEVSRRLVPALCAETHQWSDMLKEQWAAL